MSYSMSDTDSIASIDSLPTKNGLRNTSMPDGASSVLAHDGSQDGNSVRDSHIDAEESPGREPKPATSPIVRQAVAGAVPKLAGYETAANFSAEDFINNYIKLAGARERERGARKKNSSAEAAVGNKVASGGSSGFTSRSKIDNVEKGRKEDKIKTGPYMPYVESESESEFGVGQTSENNITEKRRSSSLFSCQSIRATPPPAPHTPPSPEPKAIGKDGRDWPPNLAQRDHSKKMQWGEKEARPLHDSKMITKSQEIKPILRTGGEVRIESEDEECSNPSWNGEVRQMGARNMDSEGVMREFDDDWGNIKKEVKEFNSVEDDEIDVTERREAEAIEIEDSSIKEMNQRSDEELPLPPPFFNGPAL